MGIWGPYHLSPSSLPLFLAPLPLLSLLSQPTFPKFPLLSASTAAMLERIKCIPLNSIDASKPKRQLSPRLLDWLGDVPRKSSKVHFVCILLPLQWKMGDMKSGQVICQVLGLGGFEICIFLFIPLYLVPCEEILFWKRWLEMRSDSGQRVTFGHKNV